jgi:long-chain acyl-CoA synthetase
VREYSNPGSSPLIVADTTTLTDPVVTNAIETPNRVILARSVDGEWRDVSARQFHAEVVGVAKGLIAAGIGPGARVALLSRTRYEWTLIDYAIWFAGAVTVPVYETSSPDQIRWILSDSDCVFAVVEASAHAASVDKIRSEVPALLDVLVIDEGAVESLTSRGASVSDADLEQRRSAVRADDLATIIYTSGTTGRPKGCLLTHRNFISELTGCMQQVPALFADGASTLLFLPLAHVFARILEVATMMAGLRLGHSPSIATLGADLAAFKPTFVLGAPRVFEKVYNTASNKATGDGKGRIFTMAADVAVAYSTALTEHRKPGLGLRARHAVFDRLVYSKFRAALGGQLRYAISGSAPLAARTAHFYMGVGIEILEGWGLTETTAAASVNRVGATKIGTVGRVLPWTTVRVEDDGELLVKGPQIFTGYLGNQAATDEVLTADGWFRTGDLGSIDDDGYVTITGRKKELIVTANGKNVSPSQLEEIIGNHPLVNAAMVVGDQRPFIAALVTLDPDGVRFWRDQHGKTGELSELTTDPDLRAEISSAIDDANETVSRAESIRKFEILPVEWSVEGGQLTPSFKLKRRVVLAECADTIERLYVDTRGSQGD